MASGEVKSSTGVIKKIGSLLLVASLSLGFFELGVWQLHRAAQVQQQAKPQPERAVINLESVAAAGHNLRDASYNRLVTFTGRYVKFFSAPRQALSSKKLADLEVGLMELSRNRAILVVRGLRDGSIKESADQKSVTGRLYPRQNEDHANGDNQTLSRLDPALVAGIGSYQLFDGYVTAIKESDSSGKPILGDRVPAPQLINPVGGFYWQHIAYVITWWFMAILVLFAPFYNRSVNARRMRS